MSTCGWVCRTHTGAPSRLLPPGHVASIFLCCIKWVGRIGARQIPGNSRGVYRNSWDGNPWEILGVLGSPKGKVPLKAFSGLYIPLTEEPTDTHHDPPWPHVFLRNKRPEQSRAYPRASKFFVVAFGSATLDISARMSRPPSSTQASKSWHEPHCRCCSLGSSSEGNSSMSAASMLLLPGADSALPGSAPAPATAGLECSGMAIRWQV